MAALIKGLRFASQITNKNHAPIYIITRNHWNKDYKPGPFPKTEEERIAAAKKYNLLPEEYRPYADDGFGKGDYPHLPDIPTETKDPYYPYDIPNLKRNYHEPVHAEFGLYSEDRYGSAEPLRFSLRNQFISFMAVMAACFGIYWFFEDKKMFRPVLPKQYPNKGQVHYTFESK